MNLCEHHVNVVEINTTDKNEEQYQKYHFLIILQEKARLRDGTSGRYTYLLLYLLCTVRTFAQLKNKVKTILI